MSMNPIPHPPSPATMIPAAINHLLAQVPRSREKLAAHAGKVASFDTGLVTVKLKVETDGLVSAATSDDFNNVTIRVKMSDIPLIMQNRERAFSYVNIEGDAEFANTISQLSQTLRWEAEEDLSKLFGDIAAVRIVSTAKSVAATVKSTHQKFTENAAEYFLEENPLLIRPQVVSDFTSDVTRLRDDVERLTKRIDKLKNNLQ